MVGSPFQTPEMLVKDLKFIEKLSPEMCGIGPFVPHKDTKFKNENHGDVSLVLMLLSIIRLLKPNILLPATTALGTVDPLGREKGILHGANVVMPNLSPVKHRKRLLALRQQDLYGRRSGAVYRLSCRQNEKIGYEIVTDRGDYTEK